MTDEGTLVYEAARRIYEEARDDERVIERAKLLLLDFTSVVVATYRPDHDRLLGGARRSSAPHSTAFALSARDHFLDYDDIYDRGRVHIGPIIWPALFAMPDSGGCDFLAAYASAATMLCVLGEAAAPWDNPKARTWFLTQALGGFGAAIACSLAGDSDVRTARNALGIALMQASGTKEPAAGTGSSSRQFYPAFGAHSGVLAYELASAGFDGPPAWASGTAGFGRAYLGDEGFGARLAERAATVTPDLVADIACKPWPCCRSTHRYLNGLRNLLGDGYAPAAGGIGPDPDIGLTAPDADVWLLEPVEARTRPRTIPDGKYSIPFVVAMAMTRGVRLAAWDASALDDDVVTAVSSRLSATRRRGDYAEITNVAGGGTANAACEQPAASTWDLDAAVAKYHECVEYSGALPADLTDRLLEEILRLDESGSVHGSTLGEVLLRR